jgi:hypothetical protein
MLVVETIAKIRRLHFAQGMAIKAICRELGPADRMLALHEQAGAGDAATAMGSRPHAALMEGGQS